jgi:hypothetical protein
MTGMFLVRHTNYTDNDKEYVEFHLEKGQKYWTRPVVPKAG